MEQGEQKQSSKAERYEKTRLQLIEALREKGGDSASE
jgi:hypothetical protein